MITFPNAKINLGLSITARRSDGFHEVETVMYPIPLCDLLEIVPAERGSTVSYSGLNIPGDPAGNLVRKAMEQLQEQFALPGFNLHLHKIIPMGSGLGGGSSDAAFTLKLLNEFYSLGLSQEELKDLAGKLGSDCPFFIHNQAVLATGRGEHLQPLSLDLSGLTLILVFPDIHIETKKAYGWITSRKKTKSIRDIITKDIQAWKSHLVNDFESEIFGRFHQLSVIKNKLYETGALYASLSGSGSALFGLFDSTDNLPAKEDFPGCVFWQGKI